MRKIILVIAVIVFLVISHNLIQNTITLWQKQQIVFQTEQELVRIKEENKKLREQIGVVNQEGYVERQARDKLFYVKPGEQIVLVPKEEGDQVQEVKREEKPYWQQWLEFFLHVREV